MKGNKNNSESIGCLEIVLGGIVLCTLPYSLVILIPLSIICYVIYLCNNTFRKTKSNKDLLEIGNTKFEINKNATESKQITSKDSLKRNIHIIENTKQSNKWKDELGVVYSKDKTILESYSPNINCKEYKILDSCKIIKSFSFYAESDRDFSECLEVIRYGNNLRTITLPYSLEFVEENAFDGCDMLQAIIIPKGMMAYFKKLLPQYKDILVEQSNKDVFLSTEVYKEDLLNAWEDEYGVKYSPDKKRLLKAPTGIILERLVIKEGTLVICDSALQKCKIKELILPLSLCKIGSLALTNNSEIKHLIIPQNVFYFGTSNFIGGCSSLKNIIIKTDSLILERGLLYSDDYKIVYSFIPKESIEHIKIDDRVEIIATCCFWSISELSTIILPSGLRTIGASAFYGCSNLTGIEIPHKVKEIGSRAFAKSGIKNIICHSETFIIDSNILYDKIKENLLFCFSDNEIISISSNVKYIGKSAFEGNNKLKFIKLPIGLERIGDDAFYGCKSLDNIVIPHSVTYIGESALGYCPIEEIIIPKSVVCIGKDCFYFCGKLKKIVIESDINSIEGIITCAGLYNGSNIEIKYPTNCFTRFESCIFNREKTILFYCGNIAEAKIPWTVNRIGQGAFSCNRTIKKITIPTNVKSIGKYAFMTSSIEEVKFCSKDIDIEEYAFSICHRLKRIIVPVGTKKYFDSKLFDYTNLIIEEFEDSLYIESGTNYAKAIKECVELSFEWIKQYANHNSCNIQLINRGIECLTDEVELNQYIYSYGNMHYAKICDAISYLPLALWNKKLHIIDWGCGQGIASLAFLLKRKTFSATITLIEPSLLALKRAALNIKCAHSNNPNGIFRIKTLHKDFDSLVSTELYSNNETCKIHFFSNVLDIGEGYSLNRLIALIKSTQKGLNYFVCVSPFQNEEKKHRIDYFVSAFMNNDNFILRYSVDTRRENKVWMCNTLYKGHFPGDYCTGLCDSCEKKWTRIIRVFSVNL